MGAKPDFYCYRFFHRQLLRNPSWSLEALDGLRWKGATAKPIDRGSFDNNGRWRGPYATKLETSKGEITNVDGR